MAQISSSSLSLVVFMHTFITYFAASYPLEQFLRRGHGASHAGSSLIIQPPVDVKQNLLVCNAFTQTSNLQMTFVPNGTVLGDLPYKQCRNFLLELTAGDQIDFAAGNINVGSFSIAKIPESSGALLIVVHRRVVDSMGAAFISHAFAKDKEDTAQVVTIDTYMGANRTGNQVYIMQDSQDPKLAKKTEVLPLNSVVAISPGEYQVALSKQGGTATNSNMVTFSANGQSSYVVLRVGAAEEDLVVFPSAARQMVGAINGFLLVFAASMHLVLGI